MKEEITFDDFSKVDIRVGEIVEAVVPEGSEKLIKLTVDFGEEVGERTIFSGIKAWFAPEELVGVKTAFVLNLPPRKMGNLGVSEGMLFAVAPEVEGEERAVLLVPEEDVPAGTVAV